MIFDTLEILHIGFGYRSLDPLTRLINLINSNFNKERLVELKVCLPPSTISNYHAVPALELPFLRKFGLTAASPITLDILLRTSAALKEIEINLLRPSLVDKLLGPFCWWDDFEPAKLGFHFRGVECLRVSDLDGNIK